MIGHINIHAAVNVTVIWSVSCSDTLAPDVCVLKKCAGALNGFFYQRGMLLKEIQHSQVFFALAGFTKPKSTVRGEGYQDGFPCEAGLSASGSVLAHYLFFFF